VITRIEIDGFKSFLDFKLDVPPFLALVGPNSSGKSNLFDAIEYDLDDREGAVSGLLEARRGRPHELFHRVATGRPVEDFVIRISRLVGMPGGFVQMTPAVGAAIEDGIPLEQRHDTDFSRPSDERLPAAVRERFWRKLDESFDDPGTRLDVEYVQWKAAERQYVPDPEAMRGLAPAADTRALRRDGGNLAAVLGRMRETEAFGDLVTDLTALVPDVVDLVPELEEKRQEWSFDLVLDGQGPVPSTLLSDGTLRVLGLLAALHDPEHPGSLLVEEIENGLHPSRLAELLRRIHERVTDLNDASALERPLRQVILTSHSPVVVSELYRFCRESLIFMDTAVRVDPDHDRVSRVTVAKPVRSDGEPGTYVSPRQVRTFLGAVRQDVT
jgi:predicted ATPase